jgi:hypothetical protein
MPIYEFYCPDNHRIYSFYARSLAYARRTPRCPDDPAFRMERMISNFAITGRAREKPELPSGADADDPRMEKMMAEMEREFGGMDEENPDPRALARMMRKMSEMSGEKVPGEVDEMIRRMEAGEDPDKLDEQYGDALENFDPLGGGPDAAASDSLKARFRALRQPRRDPALYEMSEFLTETPPPPPAPPRRTRPARR